MKSLILAAALVALSAPVAFADNAPKSASPDAAADQAGVPDAVKTYVKDHAGDPFPYAGAEIRVGHTVDAGEVWLGIPDYPGYRWSNLAGQLVVIDAQTDKVVAMF